MIVFSQQEEGVKSFTTNGCGCCSATLYLPKDRDEIIEELRENISALKKACVLLEMDISEFI